MTESMQTPPAEPASGLRLPSLEEALAPLASMAAAPDDDPTGEATPGAAGDEPSNPIDGEPPAEQGADRGPSSPPSRRQQARELSDLRARAEAAEGELGRIHRERLELLQRASQRVGRPGEAEQLRAALRAYDPDRYHTETEGKFRQIRARLAELEDQERLWQEAAQAAHLAVWGLTEQAIHRAGERYGADLTGIDVRTTMPEAVERLCAAVEKAVKAEHAERVAELEERLEAAGARLAGPAKAPESGGRSAPARRGAEGGFDPRKSPHENLEAALAGLIMGEN